MVVLKKTAFWWERLRYAVWWMNGQLIFSVSSREKRLKKKKKKSVRVRERERERDFLWVYFGGLM